MARDDHPYAREADDLCSRTNADAVVVFVFGGHAGSKMHSVIPADATPAELRLISAALHQVARDFERDADVRSARDGGAS